MLYSSISQFGHLSINLSSMYHPVNPCICLSIHQCICPLVHSSNQLIYPSIHWSIYKLIHQFLHWPISSSCPSVNQTIHSLTHLFINQSVNLAILQFIDPTNNPSISLSMSQSIYQISLHPTIHAFHRLSIFQSSNKKSFLLYHLVFYMPYLKPVYWGEMSKIDSKCLSLYSNHGSEMTCKVWRLGAVWVRRFFPPNRSKHWFQWTLRRTLGGKPHAAPHCFLMPHFFYSLYFFLCINLLSINTETFVFLVGSAVSYSLF